MGASKSGRFKETEGSVVIHRKGFYREVPLYERHGSGSPLYAKVGSGFTRLLSGGETSTNHKWEDIIPPSGMKVHQDRLGKPVLVSAR